MKQIAKVLLLAFGLAAALLFLSLALSNRSADHLEEPEPEIDLPPAKHARKIGEF